MKCKPSSALSVSVISCSQQSSLVGTIIIPSLFIAHIDVETQRFHSYFPFSINWIDVITELFLYLKSHYWSLYNIPRVFRDFYYARVFLFPRHEISFQNYSPDTWKHYNSYGFLQEAKKMVASMEVFLTYCKFHLNNTSLRLFFYREQQFTWNFRFWVLDSRLSWEWGVIVWY